MLQHKQIYLKEQIEITIESENDEVKKRIVEFQREQKVQFSRRLISQLKLSLEDSSQITRNQLNDLIYILGHQTNRKNIQMALKIINSGRVPSLEWDQIKQPQVQTIQKYSQDPDLKKLTTEILEKILNAKKGYSENKSIIINTDSKYTQPIHIQTLLFQLRESTKLQRVCFLLSKLDPQQYSEKEQLKIDNCLIQVCQHVVNGFYNASSRYQLQFSELYIKYIENTNSKCPSDLLQNLQRKVQKCKTRSGLQDMLQTVKQSRVETQYHCS